MSCRTPLPAFDPQTFVISRSLCSRLSIPKPVHSISLPNRMHSHARILYSSLGNWNVASSRLSLDVVRRSLAAAPRPSRFEDDSSPACPGKERLVRPATTSRLVLAAEQAIPPPESNAHHASPP